MRIKNWTWADIPAVLLAAVRAATVTAGAILVRGGLPWQVFALLGIAIAGLALVIERQASERLNQPLNPQQSLGALLICWIPTLAIAVTLNALTAFSVVAPSVGKRETERAYQQYWRVEVDRIAAWTLNVRSTAARLVESKQREIDAEQARVVAARRERVSYSVAPLNALRRELAVSRDLLRKASALDSLPLEAPADHANGSQALGNNLRALSDVYVSAGGLLPTVPAPTAPASFESPIIDLPTVFINETIARHSSAIVAWVVALFLEVLSFVALWRGGRRVPLAARVRDWWGRIEDLSDAIYRRKPPVSLPIFLEPMGLAGSLFLNVRADFSLTDCMPRLTETLANHPEVGEKRSIVSITGAVGKAIDEDAPLLPQLAGGQLVITLEAA